jgi:hypothetical protein
MSKKFHEFWPQKNSEAREEKHAPTASNRQMTKSPNKNQEQ